MLHRTDHEYYAQIIVMVPDMPTQGPHHICTWTLRGVPDSSHQPQHAFIGSLHGGPKDHIEAKILHSASRAQDKRDS